jgi:hypothetical protein
MSYRQFLSIFVRSLFSLLILGGCEGCFLTGWFDDDNDTDSGVSPEVPNQSQDGGSVDASDAGDIDDLMDAGGLGNGPDAGVFDGGAGIKDAGEMRTDSGQSFPLGDGGWVSIDGGFPDVDSGPICLPGDLDDTFYTNIEPLISDDHVQSCNACHLSSLDLSFFVRDSPCESMACLIESGWVDFASPENSHILGLIERGLDAGQSEMGISNETVMNEHDGFLTWITFSASCHDALCPDYEDACGFGECNPLQSDGGCVEIDPFDGGADGTCSSDSQLFQSFQELVWPWHGRCHMCHGESGAITHIGGSPDWMEDNTGVIGAWQTMQTVFASGYISPNGPLDSLLLTKPLSATYGGVNHGGGAKIQSPNDQTYIDYYDWLSEAAFCLSGWVPAETDAGSVVMQDSGTLENQDGGNQFQSDSGINPADGGINSVVDGGGFNTMADGGGLNGGTGDLDSGHMDAPDGGLVDNNMPDGGDSDSGV